MSVQVNLTFNNVDEAIVALGKIVTAAVPVVVVPAAPAEPKTRKGRSDAGQSRGTQKQGEDAKGTGADASTTTPPTATSGLVPAGSASVTSTAPVPTTPAPVVQQPKAPAPSPDEVQKAVEKLFNAKGFEDCADVLSRFGVKRGKDLAEEQRADFIAKTERVIAGEAI